MSTQPDHPRPERVAMRLEVGYDLFPAVESRIRQSSGHIAVMERQHRRGQYKLTVSLPLSAAHQFAIYENKSN